MSIVITASEARKRLFPLIQETNDDAVHITITSKNGNAVLISESEFRSLEETAYLLRSPENARRLMAAKASIRKDEGEAHALIDSE